jgi:hypothetical protein
MLVELEEYDKAYEHSYALFQLDKNNGTYKRLHANVISKRVRESK